MEPIATAEPTAELTTEIPSDRITDSQPFETETETPEAAPQKRILAVDDEPGIARLIKVNLERAGYRVETAGDGAEAFDLIQENKYDLIISDVMMPKMDGMELLQKIRTTPSLAHLPVIMLTAKSQDADVTQGYAAGTDMYLTKPFSPPELLTWVSRVLQGVGDAQPEGVYTI